MTVSIKMEFQHVFDLMLQRANLKLIPAEICKIKNNHSKA